MCSTSDADDEVRAVVRGIVDAMREGVPLERMAVVIGNNEPYARLLHDHLELAGIAHNGVSVRTLADSVLGRGLLRLLALPDHEFRRDDVFALLAGVPVLNGRGRQAPAIHWERISREAGIVRGLAEWDARLTRYAASRVEADDDPPEWVERERVRAHALQRFIAALARDLDDAPNTWGELARWTHELVARWIGSEAARAHWSDFEQEAAVVDGIDVIPVTSLTEAVGFYTGQLDIPPQAFSWTDAVAEFGRYGVNFAHRLDKRRMEVALSAYLFFISFRFLASMQ